MATSNNTWTCDLISVEVDHSNLTNLPYSVVPVWTFLACTNGIAAPFTAVFNALIMWTVLGDQQLRSNNYNILLAALAASDFLIGLLVEPLYCWFFICLLTECGICLSSVNMMTMGVCMGLSLCSLMMTSVERYLAIKLPFWHRVHITTQRVKKIAVAVWVVLPTTLITLRILLDKHETLKKLPGLRFAVGNVLVTLYCTIKVAITSYSKMKAIKQTAMSQQAHQKQHNEQKKRQIKEYKRVFTLSILVFSSFLFYFPIIVVNVIQTAEGKQFTPEFKYIANHIAVTFINLQSLVNPLIMTLRIKNIRKTLKAKMVSCFCEH